MINLTKLTIISSARAAIKLNRVKHSPYLLHSIIHLESDSPWHILLTSAEIRGKSQKNIFNYQLTWNLIWGTNRAWLDLKNYITWSLTPRFLLGKTPQKKKCPCNNSVYRRDLMFLNLVLIYFIQFSFWQWYFHIFWKKFWLKSAKIR